jgi:hypothetical protein
MKPNAKVVREERRKFERLTGWIKHLDNASSSKGKKFSLPDNVYVAALNALGSLYVSRMTNFAKKGDSEAIRRVVRYCCEMAELCDTVSVMKTALFYSARPGTRLNRNNFVKTLSKRVGNS